MRRCAICGNQAEGTMDSDGKGMDACRLCAAVVGTGFTRWGYSGLIQSLPPVYYWPIP